MGVQFYVRCRKLETGKQQIETDGKITVLAYFPSSKRKKVRVRVYHAICVLDIMY